jgi:hypothetical protein
MDQNCVYSTLPERLELLATVLVTNEDIVEDKGSDDDIDYRSPTIPTSTIPEVRINRGTSLRAFSGADNMAYIEMSTSRRRRFDR